MDSLTIYTLGLLQGFETLNIKPIYKLVGILATILAYEYVRLPIASIALKTWVLPLLKRLTLSLRIKANLTKSPEPLKSGLEVISPSLTTGITMTKPTSGPDK